MKSAHLVKVLCILEFAASGMHAGRALAQLPTMRIDPGQTEVGSIADGYRLTISTSNTVYRLGDPMLFDISLQNVSSNEGSVSLSTTMLNYSISVLGPDGKQVQPTENGKTILFPVHFSTVSGTLEPGNSLVIELALGSLFEIKDQGEYTVSVSRTVQKRDDIQKLIKVTCPPLKFRVMKH